jgi:hypothetical protein
MTKTKENLCFLAWKSRPSKTSGPHRLLFLVLAAVLALAGCPMITDSLPIAEIPNQGKTIVKPGDMVDTDGDGYPDEWEEKNGYDPNDPDSHPEHTDKDGNHTDLDTDKDGLPDWWEVEYGLDPTDSTGDNGPNGDPDKDGLTNREEYNGDPKWKEPYTNPWNPDTDGDGYPDGWEAKPGSRPTGQDKVTAYDPTDPANHPSEFKTPGLGDSDDDHYTDDWEDSQPEGDKNDPDITPEKPDPNWTDTDKDGLPDWWEVEYGLDPTDSAGDNGPNGDPDEDGLTNKQEFEKQWHHNEQISNPGGGYYPERTDPLNSDTDGDGFPDGWENAYYEPAKGPEPARFDPTIPETNVLLDTDEDGLPDWWERLVGLDPLDSTGDNGRYGDPDRDGLMNYLEFQGNISVPYSGECHKINGSFPYGDEKNWQWTHPLKADTDGDGYSDGWEVLFFTAAQNPTGGPFDPTNQDSHPKGSGIDTDGDGYTDDEELNAEPPTDPTDPDSYPAGGRLVVRGKVENKVISAWIKPHGSIDPGDLGSLSNSGNLEAAGLGLGSGTYLYRIIDGMTFLGNGRFDVVVTCGTEVRYKAGVEFNQGRAAVIWDIMENPADTGTSQPPAAGNGTLTVTDKTNTVHTIYAMVVNKDISSQEDLDTLIPKAAGLGSSQGVPLYGMAGRFDETGTFSVIVSKSPDLIMYKNGVDFTSGSATVAWDELTNLTPNSEPPVPPVSDEPGIYVSRLGYDGAPGTKTEPLRSLTKAAALATASAHKTVIVLGRLDPDSARDRNTVYSSFNISLNNRTGAEITIKGRKYALTPGGGEEDPVLQGEGGKRRVMAITNSRIRLENITVKGGYLNYNSSANGIGGGVYLVKSDLTLADGVVIKDNWSRYSGGGVGVVNTSTLTIEGGEIVNNRTESSDGTHGGGGVYVNRGILILKSGSIRDNLCEKNDGGGVYLNYHAQFTMNGGAITRNNGYESGGGVTVSKSTSIFTMTGGEILNNWTSRVSVLASGGGVCREEGTFIKTGGIIYGSDNPAKTNWSSRGFTHAYSLSEAPVEYPEAKASMRKYRDTTSLETDLVR